MDLVFISLLLINLQRIISKLNHNKINLSSIIQAILGYNDLINPAIYHTADRQK